jgi:hypothetical protein
LPALLGAVLSGCSPPPVELATQSVGSTVILQVFQNWGVVFRERKPGCLFDLKLYEMETGRQNHLVWQISSRRLDGSCIPVTRVTIGETPPGFAQTLRETSRSRGIYRATVNGNSVGIDLVLARGFTSP